MSSPFMKSVNYLRKSLSLLLNLVEKIIMLNIRNTSTWKSGDLLCSRLYVFIVSGGNFGQMAQVI